MVVVAAILAYHRPISIFRQSGCYRCLFLATSIGASLVLSGRATKSSKPQDQFCSQLTQTPVSLPPPGFFVFLPYVSIPAICSQKSSRSRRPLSSGARSISRASTSLHRLPSYLARGSLQMPSWPRLDQTVSLQVRCGGCSSQVSAWQASSPTQSSWWRRPTAS